MPAKSRRDGETQTRRRRHATGTQRPAQTTAAPARAIRFKATDRCSVARRIKEIAEPASLQ
jgi:hypothetical protein